MTACYPMPITRYKELIQGVYSKSMLLELIKWKLKDNYTYRDVEKEEP